MNRIIELKEDIDKITDPSILFEKIKKINIDYDKENFIIITLNTKNKIINCHLISIGILDASLIHPREIFKKAILDSAHSIILAHNHPSDSLEPSTADIEVSNQLIEASKIIGINILDHIIFNKTDFYSLKEHKYNHKIYWND